MRNFRAESTIEMKIYIHLIFLLFLNFPTEGRERRFLVETIGDSKAEGSDYSGADRRAGRTGEGNIGF